MAVDSILDRVSFGALDGAEQAIVCQLFNETYEKKNKLALNNKELFKGRKLLPVAFEFYSSKLDTTNPASFRYLSAPEAKALQQDLLYAFYIMSAQYQLAAELHLDAAEHRRQGLREYGERIKQCADLIHQLRAATAPQTPENQHVCIAADDSKQYLAYLGLTMLPSLAIIKEWAGEGVTVKIKDGRKLINTPRLYWVWAGGWVQSWISLLSDYYTHKQEAQQVLSAIAPLTGFMSFALYLMNASVEILMVAKHTIYIPGTSWMSNGELELSFGQRFKAHADLRKFSIINDFVWGLGNMACFYWLVGKGTLGYYGNVATTGLLLMDAVLSGFQYLEASKQHDEDMKRYRRDIQWLQRQIRMSTSLDDEAQLNAQLKALKKAYDQCQFEWKYKTYGLINDWTYAIALVLAFVVMCCFLLPATEVAASTALILSIGGTALCFLSSLTNDAMGGLLDIWKSNESALRAKSEVLEKLDVFKKEADLNLKKLLYLDMKHARAMFDHQDDMAYFQKMELLHEMFIKLLVPPLVVASFIFLPLDIGIAALVVGLALAIASGRLYVGNKPGVAKLPALNEEEYQQFQQSPTFDQLKPGFFSQPHLAKPSPPSGDDDDDDEVARSKRDV